MKIRILTESRAMWQLAWPVLIGQLATVGMGVADVAMTGHASANDLAAVALGASLWAMVLVTVMGVMMAINAIVAHEFGANAHQKIPHIVRQSLWMGLGVGLVACVLLNLSTVVFDHIYLEDSVRDKATQFVHVISIGLPPFACYRALYGYTASLNQTKPVMVIALFGLAFNVCINWLLIYGHWGLPQLGATGCAVATGVGMWLMLGGMILWIKKAPAYRSTYPFTQREAAHWPEIRKMLRMGLPIGVTYFAEVSAFCVIGLLVARFGVVTVSAHQIALNFSSLVFMVPLSFGIASVTRVGQALGENDPKRARFSSWVGVGLSLGFAAISALMITLFRQEIAAAYTSDVAVQQVTVKLLLLAAIFQLSDGAQVAASSAIRGYKITRTPMLIHLTAFWGVCIPLGCILGLAPEWFPLRPAEPMAASGFWISLVVGLTIAAVSLVIYLHRVSTKYLKKTTAIA